ncbi:NAD(P)-dependent alcohol dehydrogenase [Aldersonia sp. NBC_00410]|uniref:NAD(P)-dependent alcohol dehydrogenase n=1 Tax=Aldersonia sp. NBC_00410 TaxID=2975954 RepID=UPI0022552817|nr:NAD(P)-dependent alcohol dehydrogenase [Aldersonia sp. NBC_00410]MCX5045148.1 NAD(P)-dependent alcohol dehydrogenase [Aldersonia sp. NBC_00410]
MPPPWRRDLGVWVETQARAAVLTGYGEPLVIRQIEIGDLHEHEILVRIAGVGICHTDFTAAAGGVPVPVPAVLGHEGAGVVEAVGTGVERLKPGDHVVLSYSACRSCRNCRSGHPAYCAHFAPRNYAGRRADGSTTLRLDGADLHGNWFGQSSMATHAVVDAGDAVLVADDLPIELLGPLGCGIQTGAGAVLRVLRPRAGSSIVVFGAGAVGLGAVLAAVVAGCAQIVVVDPVGARRDLALSLGATDAVDGADADLARQLRKLTGGGADHSVDTVSSETVLGTAVSVLRSPGSCATLGLRGQRNPVTLDQSALLMGRSVTGVIEGDVDPQVFIPELIALWQAGRFPFDRLVTTFPFDELENALAAARDGTVAKAVLTF